MIVFSREVVKIMVRETIFMSIFCFFDLWLMLLMYILVSLICRAADM